MSVRLSLALAAVLALASGGAALACSCAPKHIPGAAEMRKLAPVIFTGVARASRMIDATAIETTFEVTEAFQGVAAGERVVVSHPAPKPGSCGVGFTVGETHTLGAHRGAGGRGLSANLCTLWMFIADDDGKLIGALRRR